MNLHLKLILFKRFLITYNKYIILDEEIYSGDNCGRVPNNMRYRLSSTKRKRSRCRSADKCNLQLPDCYDGDSAVLLKVKVLNTPPTPVRNSSLNRFQTIITQQKQVNPIIIIIIIICRNKMVKDLFYWCFFFFYKLWLFIKPDSIALSTNLKM